MPIKVQNDLPAKRILEEENIFVIDEFRAIHQDIRPLQIGIVNLMPLKEETEVQLFRALSNTPLHVDITLIAMSTHNAKNTSSVHLQKFYLTPEEIFGKRFDGLIITGAPVEQLPFEKVDYWEELKDIFLWAQTHVTSTLHLCWGAQAGLYFNYGVNKVALPQKMFGVFEHRVLDRRVPLVRGFDDLYMAPHSRHTGIDAAQVAACEDLTVLVESEVAGPHIIVSKSGRDIYVLGHPEYDRITLDKEYKRDVGKRDDVALPVNYYTSDDPDIKPNLTWRAHANAMYSNWLNYYVYQVTPYRLDDDIYYI
jgi:homoserine O-succinyltransferase